MPFFKDVDSLTIVERHTRRVAGMEEAQARHVLRLYVLARKNLRERLNQVEAGTFTEAQLKVTLVQIEAAIRELNRQLGTELRMGIQMSKEQSIEDLIKEINVFEKEFNGIKQDIPFDRILFSLDSENLLFNRYEASMEAYNEQLRSEMQRILTQAVIERLDYRQAVNRIHDKMQADEWKAHRIVRTELHNIYNTSKMSGMREIRDEYLPDMKKTLIHPMDERTGNDSMVLARLNPIVDIDEPFTYTFNTGKQTITRTFQAPPDRPNDRAILVPYRPSWDK
jgi:hypothetical protein